MSGTPLGTAWFLMMGEVATTPTALPCFSWLNNPQTLAGVTTNAAGLASGTLNVPVGAVHSQFGLQCVSITGTQWNFAHYRFTNALRVTVGGGL